ncbi:site-2 protease family protein [Undibacterium pigrum]|uniref:Peptidase M50-like protein n=1 Tax=Undibacterium pigrum TaxID=401470 RepID=A0A318IXR9_9BURK|nr:site-2 protease family protein [Undibacterium pigrum]PXX35295.1 peptidase M50-like protein [Undibacterium pigrum]
MLNFFIILVICNLLHLPTIAIAGWAAGVEVQKISLGFGPTLLQRKNVVVKLIPLTGYVRFRDTRNMEFFDGNPSRTFDRLPALQQILVALTGCAIQLALAFVILGQSALTDFLALFEQYFMGALSPFELAPSLLHDAYRLIQTTPFFTLLGIVAAKMAAYHLLPLAGFNGTQIITILAQRLGLDKFAPQSGFGFIAILSLASVASWCIAIIEAIKR